MELWQCSHRCTGKCECGYTLWFSEIFQYQFCGKMFQSPCSSLVAYWTLNSQNIKGFLHTLALSGAQEKKKTEEPVSAFQIESFQGESHHVFLPNYRRCFLFSGIQRPLSQGSVLLVESSQKHSVRKYALALPTHKRAVICSPGHSHLILLLFHRNGLRRHKSIPAPTHIKGNQRGTESRHWIYQIPFRQDAQISTEPLLKFLWTCTEDPFQLTYFMLHWFFQTLRILT